MRKYLFTNLLILVLATSVTSIVLSGCITNGPRLAYQVVGGTEVTVDVALAAYDAFAKAGKTTIARMFKLHMPMSGFNWRLPWYAMRAQFIPPAARPTHPQRQLCSKLP